MDLVKGEQEFTSDEMRSGCKYIDVGKENRYMMWASLDIIACERIMKFCYKLDLDLDQVINRIIIFALYYYGDQGEQRYKDYLSYIQGKRRDYRPIMITSDVIDKYFSFTVSRFNMTCE